MLEMHRPSFASDAAITTLSMSARVSPPSSSAAAAVWKIKSSNRADDPRREYPHWAAPAMTRRGSMVEALDEYFRLRQSSWPRPKQEVLYLRAMGSRGNSKNSTTMSEVTKRAWALGFIWMDHHRELEAKVRAFTAREILPHIDEWDARATFPVDLIRKMGREGYLGIDMAAKYGGGGADAVSACIISEEVGKAGGGINGTLLVQGVIALHPILKLGNEEQKQKYLPQAIRGEKIAAIAMTEPE